MPNPAKVKIVKNTQSPRSTEKKKLLEADKKLEKLKSAFEVLSGCCEVIGNCLEGRKVFEKVLNIIGKSVEFSQASLFYLDRKSKQMKEVVSVGKAVDLIDFVKFESGMGFSAWVAKEKRPILLSNLHRKRGGGTMKSFLSIPLILEGELIGVMNLSHIKANAFERSDVEFLQLAAAPISLSLERKHYYSLLEEIHSELERVKERSSQLEEEVSRLKNKIPTSQLLENLNQRIKSPSAEIAENAQFLLDTFSPRQENIKGQPKKGASPDFKRGLRQIRNEAHQVTKATERLLSRSIT
jgi:transcriptional regulator with GAF, ATPase, and Fis domain